MNETLFIFAVPFEILARGGEALRAYRKALEDGYTYDLRVPVMIVGQDRSGKTSSKKSLKGEAFDPEEDSTNGIDVDPMLCEFATEVWRPTSLDAKERNYAQRAADVALEHMKLAQQSRKETSKTVKNEVPAVHTAPEDKVRDLQENSKVESKGVSPAQAPIEPKKVPLKAKSISKQVQQSAKDCIEPKHTIYTAEEIKESNQKEELAVRDEMLKKLQLTKNEAKKDDEAIELVLWDFAGQSFFYTTHVLFLSRIAMYILTHNLNNALEDKAVSQVKCGIHKRNVDTECDTTNLDFIHYWLSSIHALSHESKAKDLPAKLPVVFLVCTHADKPASGTQPEEVGKSILSNLGKSHKKHLVKHTFKVDNTRSGSEQGEDEEVKRLKKKIVEVAKQLPHLKEKIPLR